MSNLVWDFALKVKEPETVVPEFAVLVLNQPLYCDPRVVKAFWNKASIRGLVDGGSNRWLKYLEEYPSHTFCEPDFISGDFDSITPKTKEFYEKKKIHFISTPDQDETDFSKALRCVEDISKEKKIKLNSVLVFCENCGRLDQILGNMNTLHRSNTFIKDVPVVIVGRCNVSWILRPGKNTILVKEEFVKEKYSCGVMPLCGPTKITTSGLEWNLVKQKSFVGDLLSTSNRFLEKKIEITCDRDTVFTTEFNKSDM